MKKILYKTIACLLIPSFVFAQTYSYRGNDKYIKPTDLSHLLNAIDTEVGKEIVTYVETKLGSIDIEHAKAFYIGKGDVAFVPIKTFTKNFAALCYTHLENDTKFLYLIAYDENEKAMTFSFPSGQMYQLKSSGGRLSINPHFQFQQHDDLNNNINIADYDDLYSVICMPFALGFLSIFIGTFFYALYNFIYAILTYGYRNIADTITETGYLVVEFFVVEWLLLGLRIFATLPILLHDYIESNYPGLDADKISIIIGIYWYGCMISVP